MLFFFTCERSATSLDKPPCCAWSKSAAFLRSSQLNIRNKTESWEQRKYAHFQTLSIQLFIWTASLDWVTESSMKTSSVGRKLIRQLHHPTAFICQEELKHHINTLTRLCHWHWCFIYRQLLFTVSITGLCMYVDPHTNKIGSTCKYIAPSRVPQKVVFLPIFFTFYTQRVITCSKFVVPQSSLFWWFDLVFKSVNYILINLNLQPQ